MNHPCGLDRHHTLLLPERFEDYIAPDNSMRFLDALLASLDVRPLGFAHAVAQKTGSPPYDRADLLRFCLYGYLHRVRSSRLLESECQRNVEVLCVL
jgi:transposase